jgi:hypothetical protein
MDKQLKYIYISTNFVFPGISNKEINKITKEVPLEEEINKYVSLKLISFTITKERLNQISETTYS